MTTIELWVAKDNNEYGDVYLYDNKPIRAENCWIESYAHPDTHCHLTNADWFPGLTFENSPRKVKIIIED
jgi:hypothetical protein